MLWLWLFISGLILVIVLLLIKIHLLRKSAKEIECSFAEKLITDSNTLIDISSNDKYMCHLANEINIQLRKLRAERRKFQKGDIELKNAVTNVSHDLRTPLTAIYGYLDLLEQEEKSEKVNRYIAVIKNRTEMLKQLTEELFRYSVILTSEEDLKIEPITINNVLEESIASFYTILKEKQKPFDITNPAHLLQAIEVQAKLNIELTQKVAVLEPKAKGLDRIADCTNVLGIREAAKVLKIGQNQLAQYLVDHNF